MPTARCPPTACRCGRCRCVRPTRTPWAAQLEPDPRGSVGGGELVDTADLDDLLEQRGIIELTAARRDLPGPPVVVGRFRDVEDPQDETGREVMGVDEAHDHLRVGPISLAKYALAARRTSLTRRSSAFSRASRAFSASMSVLGRSCRCPASASA